MCSAVCTTVPAGRTASMHRFSAASAPAHSLARSAPIPPVSSSRMSVTGWWTGSAVITSPRPSPSVAARARRAGSGSDSTTRRAPAASAYSVASEPIGPAPVISTVCPGCSRPRSTP